MTQLNPTHVNPAQRQSSVAFVAALALASALLGGIVGNRIEAIADDAGQPAPVVSARDRAVLEAGLDWEIRYRQMYPGSR